VKEYTHTIAPGRELDAFVAEKVMGWTRHRRMDGDDVDYDFNWVPPQFKGDVAYWRLLPHYSTEIRDAWEVVKESNAMFELYSNPIRKTWTARFKGPFEGSVTVETAPHAICVAALRAIGAIE
jgi:hypothetical protein